MPDNEKDEDFKVTLTVKGVNARSRHIFNNILKTTFFERGEALSQIIEDWAKDRLKHDPQAWEIWDKAADEYAERCREKAGTTSEKFDHSAGSDHVQGAEEDLPEPE